MRLLLCLCILLTPVIVIGNTFEYESRQKILRDLSSDGSSKVHRGTRSIVRSFLNEEVVQEDIDMLLSGLDQDRDAAFRIVILIRILSFAKESAVRQEILNALEPIPFWITKGEDTRVYWSENQQILWMSSAWILHEKYPDVLQTSQSSLKNRLVYYLNLKNDFGFFEFFSSVYWPYTLQGLLNLVDFCDDPEIQSLSIKVTEKLLSHILLMVNSQGSFVPAASRNYVAFYLGRRAINDVVWMLTGFGEELTYLSHIGAFFATTSNLLDVSSIIGNYSTSIEATIPVGPSLSESFVINSGLSRLDRTIINQWGMGAYFHPDAASDTLYALNELDLWSHSEFAQFEAFSSSPTSLVLFLAELLGSVTKSSVLSGQDVKIFRDRDIVLSSVQGFWPGHLGYQVYPVAATTGTKAIWTQSGQVVADWSDRPNSPSNTHLPNVEQRGNTALIIYDPKGDLELIKTFAPDSPLSVDNYEVALHWPSDFDEEKEAGRWKFAREGDSYVGVFCHCMDTIQGILACSDKYQVWAVIVGNAALYNSFDEFANRILNEDAKNLPESAPEWIWTVLSDPTSAPSGSPDVSFPSSNVPSKVSSELPTQSPTGFPTDTPSILPSLQSPESAPDADSIPTTVPAGPPTSAIESPDSSAAEKRVFTCGVLLLTVFPLVLWIAQ